jgi:hypothetical protein
MLVLRLAQPTEYPVDLSRPPDGEIIGRVAKIEPGAILVSSDVPGSGMVPVVVTKPTRVAVGTADGWINDVRPGGQIKVAYDLYEGKRLARSVEVLPEQGARRPAPVEPPAKASPPATPAVVARPAPAQIEAPAPRPKPEPPRVAQPREPTPVAPAPPRPAPAPPPPAVVTPVPPAPPVTPVRIRTGHARAGGTGLGPAQAGPAGPGSAGARAPRSRPGTRAAPGARRHGWLRGGRLVPEGTPVDRIPLFARPPRRRP